jgi:hypothetical protein
MLRTSGSYFVGVAKGIRIIPLVSRECPSTLVTFGMRYHRRKCYPLGDPSCTCHPHSNPRRRRRLPRCSPTQHRHTLQSCCTPHMSSSKWAQYIPPPVRHSPKAFHTPRAAVAGGASIEESDHWKSDDKWVDINL